MTPLLVATRSAHKLREIQAILEGIEFRLVDLSTAGIPESPAEDAIESYETFTANALAKAHHFARESGLPALGDDSGLCVDALDGAPGVRSKRFSGRDDLRGAALDRANNSLLLARLQGVPPERRTAHYVCAVALATPDGREIAVQGRCDGRILEEPRGGGGFGYDPLFLVPDLQATFAEIPPEQKNRISHRARALEAARELLRAGWISPGNR